MPSGVIRLRMSKKDHPVPRVMTMGHHERGKAGNTGLDNGQMEPSMPGRTRPFKIYENTGYPKAAEHEVLDVEGPNRERKKRRAK